MSAWTRAQDWPSRVFIDELQTVVWLLTHIVLGLGDQKPEVALLRDRQPWVTSYFEMKLSRQILQCWSSYLRLPRRWDWSPMPSGMACLGWVLLRWWWFCGFGFLKDVGISRHPVLSRLIGKWETVFPGEITMLMSTKPCYSKQKIKMFPYKLVDTYEGNQPLAAWTWGHSIGGTHICTVNLNLVKSQGCGSPKSWGGTWYYCFAKWTSQTAF